ncbi:hypothetical protein PSI23_04250 [Xenorhabdus sp. XENO-10]|uniref:Uncharacterized protein n=1 Tax=Xenorhabdus yunnanensis TaxID=3025878 RepID=A0ABT5LFF1_9GAMM|nr:hypothetical protein [Xenorhabdus yunnanensis]MDC9588540.1 hypothetical protein [Xenorhabdus yunnanensis]
MVDKLFTVKCNPDGTVGYLSGSVLVIEVGDQSFFVADGNVYTVAVSLLVEARAPSKIVALINQLE